MLLATVLVTRLLIQLNSVLVRIQSLTPTAQVRSQGFILGIHVKKYACMYMPEEPYHTDLEFCYAANEKCIVQKVEVDLTQDDLSSSLVS